jgi:hypothetical protein
VTCPTTSSFGTSKPYLIFWATLLLMVSLENRAKKSEMHSVHGSVGLQ